MYRAVAVSVQAQAEAQDRTLGQLAAQARLTEALQAQIAALTEQLRASQLASSTVPAPAATLETTPPQRAGGASAAGAVNGRA